MKRIFNKTYRVLLPFALLVFSILHSRANGSDAAASGLMLFIFVLCFTLSYFAMTLTKAHQFLKASPARVTVDISDQLPLMPHQANNLVQRLQQLGFFYWGATQTHMAVPQSKPVNLWVFMNLDAGTTHAYMVMLRSRPAVEFASVFEDFSRLETMYPSGSNLRRPHVWNIIEKRSVESALQSHLKNLEVMIAEKGSPRVLNLLLETIEWDERFRHLYPEEGVFFFTDQQLWYSLRYFAYLFAWVFVLQMLFVFEYAEYAVSIILMVALATPLVILGAKGGEVNT